MNPQILPHADTESAAARPGPAPAAAQYVINLCSSTTPMALQQPKNPELRHYKFFISRRLEDGRERFRLHMGYFDTLLQAEDMLQVVREVYPSAWVSETPGKRLREQVAPTVAPTVVVTPGPATPEPVFELELEPEPLVAPAAAVAAPAPVPAPASAPAARAKPAPAVPAAPPLSNVREVMAALDAPFRGPPASLSDSQVLRVLEGGPSDTGIDVVRPEETGTFAAIREAVQNKAPVAFAVQLQWSVQPVDLARVPPLAIFSAYKLYTVEGNRDGRRWYGLRLGFFTDANAARQVAQYVRAEFASVAVVPVSPKERDGASGAGIEPVAAQAGPAAGAKLERLPEQTAEFKLFDDTTERRVLDDTALKLLAATQAEPPPAAPAARTPEPERKRNGARVQAGEKRAPQTLEETLEILGADALSVDDGRGLQSAGSVKHLAVTVEKRNSRLGRLFGKLADR